METTQTSQSLYQALWNSADVLRSKMDANDYKSYLLGMVFYKYLSDKMLFFVAETMEEETESLEEALAVYETEEPRGECVVVIEGKSISEIREERMKTFEEMSLEEHMELYEKQGIERKEAMRMVAKDRGISKRDVYQQLMK